MDGEVDSQDVFELLLYIARTAVGEKDVVFHEDPTVNRWLILIAYLIDCLSEYTY